MDVAVPDPQTELLLMTVDEYCELPEREDVIQELHWGQVVHLTHPKMKHTRLQYRLVELLRPLAAGLGMVAAEVPFRALPEYDVRGADVAFVSRERWNKTGENDYLQGSPELVIEVLSPSNTKAEMREKAALYLSTGCVEFWVVDPKGRTVSVTRRNGQNAAFGSGARIHLDMLGSDIAVDEIFVTPEARRHE
jgi:Uma2 family endonuclease